MSSFLKIANIYNFFDFIYKNIRFFFALLLLKNLFVKLAKIYDCLAKTKEQIEEINKDKENAYENKKTATDFFFSRVKDQMKQTLNEIKESEDSFTMFPEFFIQIDIQKNFPLCNHS